MRDEKRGNQQIDIPYFNWFVMGAESANIESRRIRNSIVVCKIDGRYGGAI